MSDPNHPTPPPALDYYNPQDCRTPPRGFPVVWIEGVAVAVTVLAAAMLWPSFGRNSEAARRVYCASNMQCIGTALQLYAIKYQGAFPDRFEQLIQYQNLGENHLVCPSSDDKYASGPTTQAIIANIAAGGCCSYVYLGKGLTQTCDPEAVLAYEPLANHNGNGGNVLFGDGHVEFVPPKYLQRIIAIANTGVRPVILPPATMPTTAATSAK